MEKSSAVVFVQTTEGRVIKKAKRREIHVRNLETSLKSQKFT
jgi:hypothetical protein